MDTTALLVCLATVTAFWFAWRFVARRMRKDMQLWRDARLSLPPGIRRAEKVLVYISALLIGPFMLILLHVIYMIGNGGHDAKGIALGLLMASSILAGLTIFIPFANALGFVISPIRRANRAAFAAHPGTSYRGAFARSFQFAAVLLPVWLLLAALALTHPWGNWGF